MQRIDALKAAARNLNDLLVDTVPASYTSLAIDITKLIQTSQSVVGKQVYIYSGAGAGQERTVGSFDPVNRRVFFPEALGSIPSTNSNLLILNHFRKDEYDNAFDRAYGMTRLINLQEKTATLSIVATQYEYPVPSGFEYIATLRLVPSGWTDYSADDEVADIFEIPSRYWRIEANAVGTYIIAFDSRKINLDGFDDEWVNVIGQVKPFIAGTDNASIPSELEEYIIAITSLMLSSQRIAEGQEWRVKFGVFKQQSDTLENYIYRSRRGKRVG